MVTTAPEKYPWQGFDQVKELEMQNTMLMLDLDKRDQEIKKLKKQLQDARETHRPHPGNSIGLPAIDIDTLIVQDGKSSESKIIELAKKNRLLNVSLEKERARAATLLHKNKSLEEQQRSLQRRLQQVLVDSDTPQADLADDAQDNNDELLKLPPVKLVQSLRKQEILVKSLKEKNSQLVRKLEEERQNHAIVKRDLQLAQRVLAREVGDDVPLSKIMNSESGWRGRAQQITLLKGRLDEYKADVERLSAQVSKASSRQVTRGTDFSNNGSCDGKPDEEIESTDKVPEGDDADTNSIKDKRLRQMKASRSYDDQHKFYIERLGDDRKAAKDITISEAEKIRAKHRELRHKYEGVVARNTVLENDLKNFKQKINTLVSKSITDDELIRSLQEEMKRTKSAHAQQKQAISSQKQMKQDHQDGQADLTHLRKMLKEKDEQLQKQLSEINDLHHQLVEQADQIENITHAENEQSQSTSALHLNARLRVSLVEIEKLNGLKKLLQLNLDKAEKKCAEYHLELLHERKKSAVLERQCGITRGNLLGTSQSDLENEVERLREKLSIQLDENAALKTMVQDIIDRKEAEVQSYCDLLSIAKDTFQNTLKDMGLDTAGAALSSLRVKHEPLKIQDFSHASQPTAIPSSEQQDGRTSSTSRYNHLDKNDCDVDYDVQVQPRTLRRSQGSLSLPRASPHITFPGKLHSRSNSTVSLSSTQSKFDRDFDMLSHRSSATPSYNTMNDGLGNASGDYPSFTTFPPNFQLSSPFKMPPLPPHQYFTNTQMPLGDSVPYLRRQHFHLQAPQAQQGLMQTHHQQYLPQQSGSVQWASDQRQKIPHSGMPFKSKSLSSSKLSQKH